MGVFGDLFSIVITQPLGYAIRYIYEAVNNYGLAIIIFTLLMRIVLFPLSWKQQKSMAKQMEIQPLLLEIQKKYKNDKNKLNEEMLKLYQKYDINPMGGCLPLLIQFPILIGLIQVIYRPITYILRYDVNTLASLVEVPANAKGQLEIYLAGNSVVNEYLRSIGVKVINFHFLGIDLTQIPKISAPSELWIIPILATLITFAVNKVSQAMQANTSPEQAASMRTMNMIMPVITLVFTFQMPVGASLYWLISSLIQVVQQLVLNKIFIKKIVPVETKKGKKKEAKKIEDAGDNGENN